MASSEYEEKPPDRLSKKARQLAESVVFALLRGIVRLVPLAALGAIGRRLGDLGYRFDRRHRQVGLEGIALAFPDLDEARRREIVRGSFRNLACTLLDALAVARLGPEATLARYRWEGWEHLEAAERGGRGVLLMTAHFGNWEAIAQGLALRDHPILSLVRPLDNPRLERWVSRFRCRFGNVLVPKRAGARKILETLRDGGRVVLLIDQRVHPNEGKAYRFFGQPAYTSPLLADASLRTGAPVVPVYGYPSDGGDKVRVVIRPAIAPPAEWEDDEAAVERLTLGYLAELEATIARDPDLWLWMHRRWRKNPTWIFKKRLPRHAAGPDSDQVIG